jgi:hypothetical protein
LPLLKIFFETLFTLINTYGDILEKHSEMHVGNVKRPLFLSTFNRNWGKLTNFSKKGTILWDVMPHISVQVSQKTAVFIVTVVRTSNPTNISKIPHYQIS